MRPIGGYFELQLLPGSSVFHSAPAIALKSGRASISLLLRHKQPEHVWLPYYTCDALLEPLKKNHIKFSFYEIDNNFEIAGNIPEISPKECIIYINFFGLKNVYSEYLESKHKENLWLDHTQAFFYKPVNIKSFHFNSARKFFGVPDGSYLYGPDIWDSINVQALPRNNEYKIEHLILRYQGKVAEGHKIFKENESLSGHGIARMSQISESILSHVNYNESSSKRKTNYNILHDALGKTNQLPEEIAGNPNNTVPICYPYLPPHPIEKEYFWENSIFVPTFWQECIKRSSSGYYFEKMLSNILLPLPIDQRYGEPEMNRIIELIKKHEK